MISNNVWQCHFNDQWPKVLPKIAEDFVSYILKNKLVPENVSGKIASYRLTKIAETIHKSNDLNKQLKTSFDV